MQRRQAVHIGGINVGAGFQQPQHLLPVAGQTRGQEHAAGRELDASSSVVLRIVGLSIRVRLLPTPQLLGPLRHGRIVAHLERHCGRLNTALCSGLPGAIFMYSCGCLRNALWAGRRFEWRQPRCIRCAPCRVRLNHFLREDPDRPSTILNTATPSARRSTNACVRTLFTHAHTHGECVCGRGGHFVGLFARCVATQSELRNARQMSFKSSNLVGNEYGLWVWNYTIQFG